VPRDAALAAAGFVLTAVIATVAWQLSGRAVTDIALYHTYGERLARGLVPYRDFAFEYPPGALPALALPALVTDSLGAYRAVFAAEMAVAGAAGVLLLAAALGRLRTGAGERRFALAVVTLVPLLLGGVILTRFDLLPSALVAGAMLLLVGGRLRAGAFVVGVGIAVKLYPVVLVPLVGVVAWRRGRRRELAAVLALAAAPVVPPTSPSSSPRRRGCSTRSGASSAARCRSRASARARCSRSTTPPAHRFGGRPGAGPRT
jgi:hypothetical protein